tara:strand:- start:209 stop:796 length:588 start_codon:yes stop_codon:yes gene_type:complete
MDNLIHPFPCPIYQNIIDKKSFSQIQQDTDNFINNNNNLFKKPSSWLCDTFSTIETPIEKNINSKILKEKIKFYVEEYLKFWDWDTSFLIKMKDCWVNIAKKGSFQEEHNHSSCLISGVIYINVNQQSGNFQLMNPLSSESILLGEPKNFGNVYNINPQPGMIILFPGWMAHRALPSESNIDRISISFNIISKYN